MSLRYFRPSFAAFVALSTLGGLAQQPDEPVPPADTTPALIAEELVGPIKLADADVDTLIGALEIYTGRTVLRPQALPTATYTLKLNKAVPKSEAITALETLLSLNGVGISPLGDRFLKVVPLTQVKNEAPEMIEGSAFDLPPSGRVATKLFQLEFLRVNEFVPQISPLMSPGVANGIVSLDKANAALITDTVSNLQRVEALLNQLDKPNTRGLTPKFYALRGGSKASELVAKLRTLFQGPLQSQLGTATTYSADDRTNQIILLADERQVPLFDDLIAKLDIVAEPNTRNEVIFLKHAASKDVATLLTSIITGQNSSVQRANGGNSTRPNPVTLPAAATPAAAVNGNAPTAPVVGVGMLADATNEFSSLITVVSDDRSNSVVVSGTVDDIRLIKDLVDKLDILLAQVRIEVIIAEVTLSDSDKTGISALRLTVGQNPRGVTKITNFGGAVAGWDFGDSGIVDPLSFAAVMTDVGKNSNVKILSAPSVMTTHNKEAQIKVGSQQPIISAIQTSLATGTEPVSNEQVTYKDIAIDLKVTPLIGDDGSIQLKISQEVNDVIGNVMVNDNEQPIIGTRLATSFVNVQDGQMIVLGGLQRTKRDITRNKLGFLAEIPILSQILGGRTKADERTELLLFIRPHVIPPHEGLTETRKDIDKQSNKQQIDDYLAGKPQKK